MLLNRVSVQPEINHVRVLPQSRPRNDGRPTATPCDEITLLAECRECGGEIEAQLTIGRPYWVHLWTRDALCQLVIEDD